jgi:hypothetical protein
VSKILAIVVGFAAGAVGGPLIVLALMFWIYDSASKSWDPAIPIYILGAGAAALFGGAMGALSGLSVSEGRVRRGLLTFAGSMAGVVVLTLLVTAGIWVDVHRPNPGPSKRDKERWAATRGGLDPQLGVQLAHQLLDCHARIHWLTPEALAMGGCQAEQSSLIGAARTSYDGFDKGWRWQTVTSPRGYRVVVRPDPLLQQPGPVFEFDDERLLVKRDSPDAPPFAVDSPLPAVEAYRQCISASSVDGCRHLERQRGPAEKHRGGPADSHAIVLEGTDGRPLDVRLFPRGGYDQGKFELHVAGRGRHYMFLEGDGWHVTNNPSTGGATSKSPRPEPCELDRTVPCATEAQQTAHADAPGHPLGRGGAQRVTTTTRPLS